MNIIIVYLICTADKMPGVFILSLCDVCVCVCVSVCDCV